MPEQADVAPPRPTPVWQNLAALSLLTAKWTICSLRKSARYRVVRWIGRFASCILRKRRHAVFNNLQVVLQNQPALWERKTTEVFENFALTLCDFLNPKDITYEVTGSEHLEALRGSRQGVLFVTFHLGHWELGAKILCEKGWLMTAVYQPYMSHLFQRVIDQHRHPRLQLLPVGRGAAFGSVAALAKGEGVALIGDKAFGEPGQPISMMGQTVLWPRGPYLLAARSGAIVVPSLVVRVRPGHYKGFVDKPIPVRKGSLRDAAELSQKVARFFETHLRMHPEQWYRFEPFWIGNDT